MIQTKLRFWKIVIVAILLVFVSIWLAALWAEKAFATSGERWLECEHYEFQQFHAFSLRDKALNLWPSFGGRATPVFFRILDKKSGLQLAETQVHWISISPQVTCPNNNSSGQLSVYFSDEVAETFTTLP